MRNMLEVVRDPAARADEGGPSVPHMTTPEIARRLEVKLADLIHKTLAEDLSYLPEGAAERAAAAVPEFFRLYGRRPVKDNKGGSLFNDSLWIFAFARALDPRLIIESGVFKGHSTWLLRQACPAAQIHAFDVDLGHLVYRDPRAIVHPCDWTQVDLPVAEGRTSLVFFDDHISHAQRLCQAHERGFRHLLLDDNFPVTNLYATGHPPVPTLDMVMDPELPTGTEVRWSRNGKQYRYCYREQDVGGAKALIARYRALPDLAPITRYSPGSGLTAVKLID